jgi:hypothetical protein
MHGSREKNGDQDRRRCNTVVAAAGVLHFDLTVSAAGLAFDLLGALFLIVAVYYYIDPYFPTKLSKI